MGVKKYKYYFKKPRSEIVKDVLYGLLVAGAIYIAAASPYFGINLWRAYRRRKKYPKRKLYDAFYNLRRQGLIRMEEKNRQIYISLTEKGKKKARWMQINDLLIKKPKRWDGKWRIVIFDIFELKRDHREAFRGKLKELGFCQLQKSVWVHAFDCQAEIELLKDFFGLSEKEVRLIVAEHIGDDAQLKERFRLP